MKRATLVGAVLGLALLVIVAVHTDMPAMTRALESGGWALFWLIPYRAVFVALYAAGWLWLLRPYDPARRVGLAYLCWTTAVRDAVDRFLPVASVGGALIGARMVRWRGITFAPIAASVIIEMVLTLIATYVFMALGLILLATLAATGDGYRRLVIAFFMSLPIPVLTVVLLRNGSILGRIERLMGSWLGKHAGLPAAGTSIPEEIRASLGRWGAVLAAGAAELLALVSGSFEIWLALRLLGHPVGFRVAVTLESLNQAIRVLAFFVPAGLGVQEASLVVFGHVAGISTEMGLAVAMVKRVREVCWGLPALASWQWAELRRTLT